jgi:diguanylate cyclase (GGDEF)-like protein
LPRRLALGGGRFALTVPIVTTGPEAARRRLIVEDEREWTTMDLRMLFSLAETAALAYEIAGLAETAEHEAHYDALTGLLLRRSFEAEVENRLALARRAGRLCALAMIDLDRFKSLNDTFGHAAGDEGLRGFGRCVVAFLVKIAVTRSLIAGRVGGEEFAILGESMASADLAATLDDLRGEVASACKRPDGKPLTFSAGVAGFPEAAEEYAELTGLADKALYHAKASGRNMVAVFRQ